MLAPGGLNDVGSAGSSARLTTRHIKASFTLINTNLSVPHTCLSYALSTTQWSPDVHLVHDKWGASNSQAR